LSIAEVLATRLEEATSEVRSVLGCSVAELDVNEEVAAKPVRYLVAG
jgi:hypothetical protein